MDSRRNTYQRDIIRMVMKDNMTHPTADEIYDEVKKIDHRISRGTVYRNLAILSDDEEISHYNSPFGPDHYDCILEPHYHCLCRKCGKFVDAKVPYDNQLNSIADVCDGFKLESHNLVFVGICKECSDQKK